MKVEIKMLTVVMFMVCGQAWVWLGELVRMMNLCVVQAIAVVYVHWVSSHGWYEPVNNSTEHMDLKDSDLIFEMLTTVLL